MPNTYTMQAMMGRILLIGLLISILFVSVGGTSYLYHHGLATVQHELIHLSPYLLNSKQMHFMALLSTPLGLVEVGLLLLVITQIVRIALLVGFYAVLRDGWFTFFSTFILLTLLYSLLATLR